MSGPLAGLRVVDLSSLMSGSWAADILGDQGADVIKVEDPGTGDHLRSPTSQSSRSAGMTAAFLNVNRSKRSLTLNLKTAGGAEVLRRLVATADVLVRNFRPGASERLGIGYDDLAQANPRLICLSLSGFGDHGPLAGQHARGSLVQALTGLTTIQAGSDGQRPRLIRTALPDKLTAIVAAQAVTSALLARERTGEGQHIRLSMLESVLSFVWASDMDAYTFAGKPVPSRQDASIIDLIYETADGYVTVTANGDGEWRQLSKALGHPEWGEDERFATPVARAASIDERLALIQGELATMPTAECLARMERFDVPAAPVLKRSEAIEHPQVRSTEIIIETEHPVAGRLRQARVPARFGATAPDPPRGAPRLGEHTAEILAELGYDEAAIGDLAAQRAIGTECDITPDEAMAGLIAD